MARKICFWSLGLIATCLWATSDTARAADPPSTYVVSMCATQNGSVPLVGWRTFGSAGARFANTCGTAGGSFGLSANGSTLTAIPFAASWLWGAPQDLRLAGLRSHGFAWSSGFFGGWRVDNRLLGLGSVVAVEPSERRSWELRNLNASNLALELRCGEPDEGECKLEGSAAITLDRVDLVLLDEFAPSVIRSDLSQLKLAQPISGSHQLATEFVDRGGGAARAELLVDGVVSRHVSVDAASCARPYTVPVPCLTTGRITTALDTTSIPNGVHNVELRLYDVGGNHATVGPVSVVVQNPLPAGSGPGIPGRVSLRKAMLRTSYGGKPRVEGAVTGLDEAPLAGVTIEVASRVRTDGAGFIPVAPVVADSEGRFSILVEPGPSRVYRIRYGASEATAEVLVRAPLRLSVTPSKTRNGRAVRFRGSIPGATAPGVRVELQARAGKKWVPFRTAALKRSRFAASYRFTSTTARTRYKFRAVARADPDLPYAAATSRVVQVLVRP